MVFWHHSRFSNRCLPTGYFLCEHESVEEPIEREFGGRAHCNGIDHSWVCTGPLPPPAPGS
eukprot:6168945-Pyramimonas_sp.AAC.1